MDGFKLNAKLLYRFFSIVAICVFFIPTVTLSCGRQTEEISVANAAVGFIENGEPQDESHLELFFLLIIPAVMLIISFAKRIKKLTLSYAGVVTGTLNCVGWVYFLAGIRKIVKDNAPYLDYRVETLYYVAILSSVALVITGIASAYQHDIKIDRPHPEPDSYGGGATAKQEEFVSFGGNAYKEPKPVVSDDSTLKTCFNCHRVFAVRSATRKICPDCGNQLVAMTIPLGKWQVMSEAEKSDYLQKMERSATVGDVTYF